VILQRTRRGEGRFEWRGRSRPVPPGHAFVAIVPEPSLYFFPKTAVEPWEFDWINFYGPLAIGLWQRFREAFGPVCPLPHASPAGTMLTRLIAPAMRRKIVDPHSASTACYAFLMEWTRQLMPPLRQQSDPVETAMALCASRFREPLGVKELATETGLTREHLTRLFTARTGKPPARYLRELRLEAARALLERTGLPLKEAALRCGFSSSRSLRQALERS